MSVLLSACDFENPPSRLPGAQDASPACLVQVGDRGRDAIEQTLVVPPYVKAAMPWGLTPGQGCFARR
ncbi:MAG: hypothetical protein ABI948_11960 [Thermoleophilia bacterium]